MNRPDQVPAGMCRVCIENGTVGSALFCCATCLNHLLRVLRELGAYWNDYLPLLTQHPRGNTGRMQPGYGSSSPGRDAVFAALDPRSMASDVDEDGEAHTRRPDDTADYIRSIPGSIQGVVDWIAAERGETPGAGLDYIRANLYWCGQHPWIDELADDLKELHAQARRLANDQPDDPLAQCLVVGCDGLVYEGGPGQPARCNACKRPYTGLDLVRLGVAAEAA
ncbi:hypothetical protein ACWEOE_31650 [Amycolatopsis sp. NPDC004368]